MSSGQLLPGLLRLQRNFRQGSISTCNSLSDLASAGLLALAGTQHCQQRFYAAQPPVEDNKPSNPATKKAAPSGPAEGKAAPSSKPPTVLEAKREFRKQQQQKQKQAQEQGQEQAPPAGRPQPWQQADGAGRGLRLPPLPNAAPPAAPPAPQERVIETRRRVVATEATVRELRLEEHTNLYFPMPASTVTEAFRPRTEGPAAYLPPTGCAGLQGEYEHTGKEYVMLRACIDALMQIAARCGPLQRDPATAASSAHPATLLTARSGQSGSESGTADESLSATQAASAAQADPLDSTDDAPVANAEAPESELVDLSGVSRPASAEPFLEDEQLEAIAGLRKLYLVGPSGSGKSVALATLAHWARTSGWLVLYVPTAKALIEGGTFRQHESGGWDNPENARLLLGSLLHHHEAQLDGMPGPARAEAQSSGSKQGTGPASAEGQLDSMPAAAGAEPVDDGSTEEGARSASAGGQSLGDIARAAMDPLQGSLPVQAVLDILDHLLQQDQVPVLLAIDDYPALTLPSTDYGTGTSEIKRRQLSTSELRLAVGLRLMTRDAPKLGLTVCAAHPSSSISPLQPVPLQHTGLLALQRYSRAEVQAAMSWYTAQGMVDDLPDDDDTAWAHQITAGNARELRKLSDLLLVDLGYDFHVQANTG